ncbi:MAG: right-handed parallel beta-helix repeat-containing protein, partial [archaeon]
QAILSTGEALIRANNTSFITIAGFILENCRGTAISLRDGNDCKIVGCVIRNTGKQAVQVSGGMRHEVYGCDVYYTGESGITMSGGQRPTLTPAGHNVENNHVHHFSRRARTYNPGISIGGVGNRMAHNLIHDGPHMALSAGGNDHIVEYNEIHNVVEESGDAGAYYVGRDWTQRGNILRHNYFHQILGSTGYGGMTIYLDDQHCGHSIYGNIFERCSQTIFIGGGDDNLVTNNVFLDCWKSAHLDDRGMNWHKKATDDPNGELRSRLRSMPYQNPLWKQRYPTLAGILDDDPGVPKRNVYAGNISAGGIWYDISPAIRKHQTVEKNLAFDDDKEWAKLIKDAGGKPLRLEFKDLAAVAEIGFRPIPVEKIGLYADVRRASWPVPHQVRAVKLPEGKKRPKRRKHQINHLVSNPRDGVQRLPNHDSDFYALIEYAHVHKLIFTH